MKDLEIKLRLDRTQSREAALEHIRDARRMADASARAMADQRQGLAAVAQAEKDANRQSGAAADQRLRDDRGRFVARKGMIEDETAALKGSAAAGLSVADAIGSIGGKVAIFGVLKAAAEGVSSVWGQMRKDIEASTEALLKQRQAALEMAALNDKPGQSTAQVKANLEFRAQTLQSAPAAKSLQEGLMNTGQSAVASGFMTKDQMAKLAIKAGSFQAMRPDVDASALGNLAGTMPALVGKQNQDADSVFARLMGITDTFDKGGSAMGTAVADFQENSGLVKAKLFRSPEQMASLQSYLSLFAPTKAGTLTNQFVRGTTGALGRMRGQELEGSEKQAEYLQRLGATNQMDPIEIGRVVAKDMAEQEKKEKAAGRDFNAVDYLTHKGYGDEEARNALIAFSTGVNSGEFDKTFGKRMTPESAPTPDQAMAPIRAWQATDATAAKARSDVSEDLAVATKAAGPNEVFEQLKRQAYSRKFAKGEITGTYEQNKARLWEGPILDEVQRDLLERASKAGLKVGKDVGEDNFPDAMSGAVLGAPSMLGMGGGAGTLGGSPITRWMTSPETRAKEAYDLQNKIVAAGGDSSGINTLVDLARKQLDLTQKAEDRAREDRAKRNQGPAQPPVVQPGVANRQIRP